MSENRPESHSPASAPTLAGGLDPVAHSHEGHERSGADNPRIAESRSIAAREWLSTWTTLALISFGSPAVQLAAMHRILVEQKRWLSERRFFNALNYCFALPGPEAQLLATYTGWLMHRTVGGVMAGTLFILPGTLCMMVMSYGYVAGEKSDAVEALFYGLKPAILVIVLQSLVRVGTRFLRNRLMLVSAGMAFLASFFFNLPFAWILLACVLAGLTTGLLDVSPLLLDRSVASSFAGSGEAPLREDELPEHTRPSAARSLQTAVLWLGLWLTPVVAIVAVSGWNSIFGRIAVLFSQMAFLSVGGPYAVNSYVALKATDSYGWLTHGEVLDGFAMAELAPGPAVQFLQFVGFLAAYRNPGSLDPHLAAGLGAVLAVWITFIPTFLWIFLLAPFIELHRESKILHAILSGLTGGTLGVILTFALKFGIGTLFREIAPISAHGFQLDLPRLASIDPWAFAVALAAGIATFRFDLGIVPTLAGGCAIGLVPRMLDPALSSGMRTAVLGFLAGAAIGFPAGPLAVWCLHLRIRGRHVMQWAIIVGSAAGDVVVAAAFVAIKGLFGGMLPVLAFLEKPLVQGPALILSGIGLFAVVTRSAILGLPRQPELPQPKWIYFGAGLAFLLGLAASVTHPENLLTITAVFTVLGVQSENSFILLSGFFLGSLTMWAGAIELLCRLGQSQGRQIMLRAMQLLCVLCIGAGMIELAYGFGLI